eukprot:gene23999-32404_t
MSSGFLLNRKEITYSSEGDIDDEYVWRKRIRVGHKAVDDYLKSGMNVGVGTGSTGSIVVNIVAAKLRDHTLTDVVIVPGSEELKRNCISLGIPVCSIDDVAVVHLAIVGADEVDSSLAMVKGRTGCFLREKMIEKAANTVIVAVDDSKLTRKLGAGSPLPVEIVPFSHRFTLRQIESLSSLRGCRANVRVGNIGNMISDGEMIAVTDNGNYIVDIYFDRPIQDPASIARELEAVIGVVSHGLFLDSTTILLVADNKGVHTIKNGGNILDEETLWTNTTMKLPLEREALDNRQPLDK